MLEIGPSYWNMASCSFRVNKTVAITFLILILVAVAEAWIFWVPILKHKTVYRRILYKHKINHGHQHKPKCGWCGGAENSRGWGWKGGSGWGWKGGFDNRQGGGRFGFG
ncbi:uncharacterized protein LOC110842547 [Folsomia candida]|uniref:uncharacterized protein LOC110842547 n=1 Tax=Folsomia candida TaxID=158441 RepID=UPI000B900585|nr:uncharacterized protein LOC110842547 [Folsomia candida]